MSEITLIICTKDRPEDIKTLFTSLVSQTQKPKHVIVVDGSDNPIKDVLDPFLEDLSIEYTTVRPPSLPKQRNVGISMLAEDADWVGFLDDDLVLETDSLEQVSKCVKNAETSKELVGIAMIISNCAYPAFSLLKSFFFLDGRNSGGFTPSGCAVMYRDIHSTNEVEWVSGGVSFWRKKVFDQFKFDEWFSGTGYLEDIDFSYRVSRSYSLVSCGEARCNHYHHEIAKSKLINLGSWQLTSWWYFANKMNFPKINVLMSFCGITLFNLVFGVLKFNSERFLKFFGNIKGFLKIVTGKALLKSHWQK